MIELFNDDCMNVMKDYEDNHFDLAIVDPPYGIGMDGGNVGYQGFNDLKKKNWDIETPKKEYFNELFRICKNQIIFGGNYFIRHLYPTRCFIVWDKGEGFYNRTYAECEFMWTSFNLNAKIFKYDPLARGDYRGKIHPTQKPVKLYEWLLHNYAKKGQEILDTHLGSGSIAIACHYFGCDLVGIEMDEEYYNSATKRIDQLTRQGSLFKSEDIKWE